MKETDRKQIENFAQSLPWTPKDYYWQHTLQVRRFALLLQEKLGGDKDVVEAAALLHDIGKSKLLAPGHEEHSAQMAAEFLKSLGFANDKIKLVCKCIRYQNFEPIEARILRAADSMSLLADNSEGREWYFQNVLGGDKKKIIEEIEKSYSETEFDFARETIKQDYRKLIQEYS